MTSLSYSPLRHQMLSDICDGELRFDAGGNITMLRVRAGLDETLRAYRALLGAFWVVPRSRDDGGWDAVITIDGRVALAEWDAEHGAIGEAA